MLKPKDSPSTDPRYRLIDIPSPAFRGRPLRLFTRIVEVLPFVQRLILTRNNMQVLRKAVYSETPALLPQPPRSMFELEMSKQREQAAPRFEAMSMTPGILEYQRRYQTRQADPVDVAEQVLQRIHASNSGPEPLRAIIQVHEASLRKAAEASRQRFQEGRPLSRLDGVPVAVKSEIFVQNLDCKAGTSFLKSGEEGTLVTRLREAGALIVGITNMHEIGIGVTGANLHWGVARNPYDRQRHTGGSSSGSAAAVAAGLVPVAIGTDGGGSIRIPASLCGVTGLKPTFSRVSAQGSYPSCLSLCAAGPIAQHAVDCAMTYEVIAGSDPLPPSLRSFDQIDDLSDLTAGIYAPWFEHADPEVVLACNELLVGLQKRGLKVVDIAIPELEEVRLAHFATIAAEMFQFMRPHLQKNRRDLAPTTRFALALGSAISLQDYLQAQRLRQRAIDHLVEIFQKVDVIVSPTCAIPAPLIGDADELDTVLMGRLMRFAQLFNLTGNPAISVPAGYTAQGLPIGIQFGARWWAEADLLRLAHAAEPLVERILPPGHASPWT